MHLAALLQVAFLVVAASGQGGDDQAKADAYRAKVREVIGRVDASRVPRRLKQTLVPLVEVPVTLDDPRQWSFAQSEAARRGAAAGECLVLQRRPSSRSKRAECRHWQSDLPPNPADPWKLDYELPGTFRQVDADVIDEGVISLVLSWMPSESGMSFRRADAARREKVGAWLRTVMADGAPFVLNVSREVFHADVVERIEVLLSDPKVGALDGTWFLVRGGGGDFVVAEAQLDANLWAGVTINADARRNPVFLSISVRPPDAWEKVVYWTAESEPSILREDR